MKQPTFETFVLLICIVASYTCSPSNITNKTNIYNNLSYFQNDTLYPMYPIIKDSCKIKSIGFTDLFGIKVSNYYELVDYGYFDINSNQIIDTIGILSPKNLLPGDTSCNDENKSNRLLLIKIDGAHYLYDNVIYNELGIGTVGADLLSSNYGKGLVLQKYFGQGCYFEYKIFISNELNNFYIDSLNIRSGCQGETFTKSFNYSKEDFNLVLFERSIIDSLIEKYAL